MVLFREAVASVPEVAKATVRTLRQRLWQISAVVVTRARRIGLHLSADWPNRSLWGRVLSAVRAFVAPFAVAMTGVPPPRAASSS